MLPFCVRAGPRRRRPCGGAAFSAALFARTALLRQKQTQTTASAYMANANKVGSEEKWAQAAMEYINEKTHVNDHRKRQADVLAERRLAAAYDAYSRVNQACVEARLARLLGRMTAALEKLKELQLDACLEEALLMNAEQPPGNYRRPSLTPPVLGYEPGFGLDVPQLKNQHAEYPAVVRPTDSLQYTVDGLGEGSRIAFGDTAEEEDGSGEHDFVRADGDAPVSLFPYVDAHEAEDLVAACAEELEEIHGAVREAAPLTGTAGEAWETYVALQKKALARQTLIFDLHNDADFSERYSADAAVRAAEWKRRGMLPLTVEDDAPVPLTSGDVSDDGGSELHFAQVPAYQPFREY